MMYSGSCHCGQISYDLELDSQPAEALDCNCSICQRRGHLLWFVPRARLHLKTPESNMKYYSFNQHKIRHYFCPSCGCAPFGMGADDQGNETAAINVRCLQGMDIASLKIRHFDGRSL